MRFYKEKVDCHFLSLAQFHGLSMTSYKDKVQFESTHDYFAPLYGPIFRLEPLLTCPFTVITSEQSWLIGLSDNCVTALKSTGGIFKEVSIYEVLAGYGLWSHDELRLSNMGTYAQAFTVLSDFCARLGFEMKVSVEPITPTYLIPVLLTYPSAKGLTRLQMGQLTNAHYAIQGERITLPLYKGFRHPVEICLGDAFALPSLLGIVR